MDRKLRKSPEATPRKEQELPKLKVEPRLIVLNGVDGSGKTTIIKMLADVLRERFNFEVEIVKVANIRGGDITEGQRKIGAYIDKHNPQEKVQDDLKTLKARSLAMRRAYQERVIPALQAGKIVLLDRSELDVLQRAYEIQDEKTRTAVVEKRKKDFARGNLTEGIVSGNLIYIKISKEDAWKNLLHREKPLTAQDPQNPEDVGRCIEMLEKALSDIQGALTEGGANRITVQNNHVDDETHSKKYLETIVEEIITRFKGLNLKNIAT